MKQFLEIKSTISEIKNSLDKINKGLDTEEEKQISALECP